MLSLQGAYRTAMYRKIDVADINDYIIGTFMYNCMFRKHSILFRLRETFMIMTYVIQMTFRLDMRLFSI